MQNPILKFEMGTLVIEGIDQGDLDKFPAIRWDNRTRQYRARASSYRDILLTCQKEGILIGDEARHYERLVLGFSNSITPREHQNLALAKWQEAGGLGVVSLPTGAGKTILAVLAIEYIKRPTLVVVPTIDLMLQWETTLRKFFGIEIGMLGGGSRTIAPVTVATYDSALIHIETIGARFGLLVFDECHHLPSPQYRLIAQAAIAPFRLGLSATVARSDGGEEILYNLVGDLVFEGQIHELKEGTLAPYDVVNIQVPLSESDQKAYHKARKIYRDFLRTNQISFSGPNGWGDFVRKTTYKPGGREAMKAYLLQKKIAQRSERKVAQLWRILQQHQGERTIVFTDDNALAYRIGCELVLPVLTHQTKAGERKHLLAAFRAGQFEVLVTSKVLNEGVDVPEASIGIVLSGSGAVREHVQRLGRILRHRANKRATLYEIVSKDTSEFYVNRRRRRHIAYQGSY